MFPGPTKEALYSMADSGKNMTRNVGSQAWERLLLCFGLRGSCYLFHSTISFKCDYGGVETCFFLISTP